MGAIRARDCRCLDLVEIDAILQSGEGHPCISAEVYLRTLYMKAESTAIRVVLIKGHIVHVKVVIQEE